jgi:hypothetical protein
MFAVSSATSPFPGDHLAARLAGWSESARALSLDASKRIYVGRASSNVASQAEGSEKIPRRGVAASIQVRAVLR